MKILNIKIFHITPILEARNCYIKILNIEIFVFLHKKNLVQKYKEEEQFIYRTLLNDLRCKL